VWVLDGKVRDEVVREMKAGYDAGDSGHREYHYDMQNWREPYLARRRACGFGLYNTIGIPRGDKERMRAQQGRNYQFFDAPVGLIFSIDRDLEIGSWVDYGMFLQSIMVAARSFGLETCPQAALCSRHALLQKRLGIPPEQMVVCGMALGYADRDAIVNTFVTERMRLEEFVTFVEEVKGE
jgi:nitroreductase